MRIHISGLFWSSLPFRSPESTEETSQHCTAGSRQLSVLYIAVYTCQSHHPLHPTPHGNCKVCVYTYDSLSASQMNSSEPFF